MASLHVAAVGMSTSRFRNRPSAEGCGLWTAGEHQRFLQALELYPSGPWRAVAAYVGTRNVRQTMTHAQKHKQKLARHERGLRTKQKPHDASPAVVDMDVDAFLQLGDDDLEAPLSICAPHDKLLLQDDDELVLATPVVSDCLDYLVRCFA